MFIINISGIKLYNIYLICDSQISCISTLNNFNKIKIKKLKI